MKFWNQSSQSAPFELLRSRLESEVQRPAIIVVTASSSDDGKESAAAGIAQSLALAGYSTLLAHSAAAISSQLKPDHYRSLYDLGSNVTPEHNKGSFATLSLRDRELQETTSQREVQSVFETLRAKFDYVIIDAEYGAPTSFAASFIAGADAVLVTVRKGRRERKVDADLADLLDRIGSRYLGVIALTRGLIESTVKPAEIRGRQAMPSTREKPYRDVVESAT